MEAIIRTFVDECTELLELFEQSALRLEQNPGDGSAVAELFRAAHTIKGSAGLFGFDDVVEFTHRVESMLDRMRNGELQAGSAHVALLLSSTDHLAELVQSAANEQPNPNPDRTRELCERFEGMLNSDAAGTDAETGQSEESANPNWHISVRFGADVLRSGMDPGAFIRYLTSIGELVRIATISDEVPDLAALDPEQCYLGYEIDLQTGASRDEIENVFEFVRDDCTLQLVPPKAKLTEYLQLIEVYEDDRQARLGEILVNIGSLTQAELQRALQMQSESDPTPKLGDLLVEQGSSERTLVEAALKRQTGLQVQKHGTVRVDADKLDQLINLVGELVIASASAKLAARQSSDSVVVEPTEVVCGLVEELRENALRMRMVQIGETFSKFRRVVRDVSAELDKDIALSISGGDTELDKAVVEKIGDPLTHLVRNAIDHGIEDVETRLQRGKPAQGTVRLDAYHDSGNVVVEISDDGGGLDLERVRARAVERELIEADAHLSEAELIDLIFQPGFSTKEQVSDLSGRGVGMDVVRRNVEALRGQVEMFTRPGQGSTTRIRLPLTLAIIEGFLVGVGEARYVVPLDTVNECVELEHRMVHAEGRNFINLRGEVLPLLRLQDVFGVQGADERRANVVVVQAGERKAGLVVDHLLGEFQTVIKPMGRLFRHAHGISGSTVLGNGDVALILDVTALLVHGTTIEAQAVGSRPTQSKVSA